MQHNIEIQIHPNIHAYHIEGSWTLLQDMLAPVFTKRFSIRVSGNPDVLQLVTDTLGIDEARFVSLFQSRTALAAAHGGGVKLVILSARKITATAQNALLKAIEEPRTTVYYFLLTPHRHDLLPTLRSRVSPITIRQSDTRSAAAKLFLSKTPSERLSFLENILTTKDTAAAAVLLDQLLVELSLQTATMEIAHHRSFEELLRAQKYIRNQGSSLKLLLEHIALTVSFSHQQHE